MKPKKWLSSIVSGKRQQMAARRRCSQYERRRLNLERLEERALLTTGLLDVSFGDGGVVILEDNGFFAGVLARQFAFQEDGKIVVAASILTESPTDIDFGVARFNPDGTLDDEFNNGGTVVTDFKPDGTSGLDILTSIAIQDDDKIVVAGHTVYDDPGTSSFALARFKADGSRDLDFGPQGIGQVIYGFPGQEDYARGLAVQPDGKILLVGHTVHPLMGETWMTLVRFNEDGTPDDGGEHDSNPDDHFGGEPVGNTEGRNGVAFGERNTFGHSVRVTNNTAGHIIVGGGFGEPPTTTNDPLGFQAWFFDRDGRVDRDSNAHDSVRTEFGGIEADGLTLEYDGAGGGMLQAGYSQTEGGVKRFALARYQLIDNDVKLDLSFGVNGKRLTSFADSAGDPTDATPIMAQEVGQGYVAVGNIAGPDRFPAVARYDNLGNPLDKFLVGSSEQGPYSLPFKSFGWRAETAEVFSETRLLVAGFGAFDLNRNGALEREEIEHPAVARYLEDTPDDPDSDGARFEDRFSENNPNEGDGNGDTIPDSQQENVATLQNAETEPRTYVTIASPGSPGEETYFVGVEALNSSDFPEPPPDIEDVPVGLFKYHLGGVERGGETIVTYTLHGGEPVNSFWKYGFEPNDDRTPDFDESELPEHWWKFDWHNGTGLKTIEEKDGSTVLTVHFKDGERGDNDLIPNGVIVDPGAPVEVNLPPVITVDADTVTVDEGQIAVIGGTVSDPNPGDVVALAASAGTVTENGDGTWSWSLVTMDGPDDSQAVTVTATDTQGNEASLVFELIVDNVAPAVALDPVAAINEHEAATLTGTITDPGLLDTHDVIVDWDDPNDATDSTFEIPETSSLSAGDTFNSSTDSAVLEITSLELATGEVGFEVAGHQYLDDGLALGNGTPSDMSTIVVTVSDDDLDGGGGTVDVVVNNVVPQSVTLSGLTSINENDSYTLSGSFTDPGLLDEHDVFVDWDDPNDANDSTFELRDTNSLGLGDTFNSSTDSAVLEITSLDLATGEVGFEVAGRQYLDDGLAPGNGFPSDTSTIVVTVTDDDVVIDSRVLALGRADGTAIVTYTFFGEITHARIVGTSATSIGGISVGDRFIATVSAAAVDSFPSDPTKGVYPGDFRMTVGSQTFFNLASFGVHDNDLGEPWGDELQTLGNLDVLPAGWSGRYVGGMALIDLADTALSSDTLPSSLDLAAFPDLNQFAVDMTLIEGTATYPGGVLNLGDRLVIWGPATWVGIQTIEPSTLDVLVNNVAPEVSALSSDATFDDKANAGELVNILANFTDVGILDTHVAEVDWGDGTVEPATITAGLPGNGTVTGAHAYAEGGIYQIKVTLTDDDTGQDEITTTAVVTGVGLVGDVLYVIGTADDDHVTINKAGQGLLKAHADFLASGNIRTVSAAEVNQIIAYLCEGDDHMTIAGNIDIPAIVHAGADDDHINAGGGPSVLLGGTGNDALIGGSARDILIGGLGTDRMVGGRDEDVLIGGSTLQDHDDEALMAALAAWSSGEDYSDRVNAISSLLAVDDDDEADKSTGSSGRDLFFAGLGDDLTDVDVKQQLETVL